MESNKCKECNKQYSCKMVFDRFKIKGCYPLRNWLVDIEHRKEIRRREEMLKGLRE